MHYIGINLICFRQSHGIVLVMAASRGICTAPVDSEIRRDIQNVRDFSVKRLPFDGICLNKRDTRMCVRTRSRKWACFEVICTVIDHLTGRWPAA